MDLERKRQTRTMFMRFLYEQTEGDEHDALDPIDFLHLGGLDIDEDELRKAIQYLEGEGLLSAAWTMGGLPSVTIEHTGVVEVEAGEANPELPTEHFVPIATINQAIFLAPVSSTQLQIGAQDAQQSVVVSSAPIVG